MHGVFEFHEGEDMEASGADKRRFPRVDLDMPVLVVGREGQWQARMVNVSLGGCLLEGLIKARVGEILSISCGYAAPTEGFRARVVWAVPKQERSSFGGTFWGADENHRRELVHKLINLAQPMNAGEAHLLIG